MTKKNRVTARKYMGDDMYSWAIFIDGRPFVTGLSRTEIPYYKKRAQEALDLKKKEQENGRN